MTGDPKTLNNRLYCAIYRWYFTKKYRNLHVVTGYPKTLNNRLYCAIYRWFLMSKRGFWLWSPGLADDSNSVQRKCFPHTLLFHVIACHTILYHIMICWWLPYSESYESECSLSLSPPGGYVAYWHWTVIVCTGWWHTCVTVYDLPAYVRVPCFQITSCSFTITSYELMWCKAMWHYLRRSYVLCYWSCEGLRLWLHSARQGLSLICIVSYRIV